MVLWTRMCCRSLRHECAFAADPSVEKERSVLGRFPLFQALPVTPRSSDQSMSVIHMSVARATVLLAYCVIASC